LKHFASLCIALVLALLVAACGGASSNGTRTEPQATESQGAEALEALRGFYRAGLNKDSAESCSLMSKQFIAAWSESSGGQGCEAAIDELLTGFTANRMAEQRQVMRELNLTSVRVDGNTARVTVVGESADLVKEGGKWLVDNTRPANAKELTVFSSAQLELELKEHLERRDGLQARTVICPLNQPVKVGYSFRCVVEFGSGSRAVVRIEVRNLRGGYRVSAPVNLPE
jgi:hypothetical protein